MESFDLESHPALLGARQVQQAHLHRESVARMCDRRDEVEHKVKREEVAALRARERAAGGGRAGGGGGAAAEGRARTCKSRALRTCA